MWFASKRPHSSVLLSCTGNKDPNAHFPNINTFSLLSSSKTTPSASQPFFFYVLQAGMCSRQMLPLLQSFHPYLTTRAGFAHNNNVHTQTEPRCPHGHIQISRQICPWLLMFIFLHVPCRRLHFDRQKGGWFWSHVFTLHNMKFLIV